MEQRHRALLDVRSHIPGEAGIWLLVFGDLIVFTLMFLVFLVFCAADPQAAHAARSTLDQGLGLLNTGIMLLSSWAVAHAVRAARQGRGDVVPRFLWGTIACAAAFGVVKVFEWRAKMAIGISPATNEFFAFYFALTGIHMIHVIIGAIVLFILAGSYRHDPYASGQFRNLESGATFWHMVDLIWIILLALLYLLP